MRICLKRANEDAINNVSKKDYLSALPHDCLLDVFTRLDQFDLNELEMVARQMSMRANASRSKAPKLQASKLTIGDSCFRIKVVYGRREYSLKHSHLGKFEFGTYIFRSVAIDDEFLSFFEQFTVGCSPKSCYFFQEISNVAENVQQRFLNMIISSEPKETRLDFSYEDLLVDEHFLNEYAQVITLPELKVYRSQVIYQPTYLRPGPEFAATLSKYTTLHMPSLIYNAPWLIQSLMHRLRLKKTGSWWFRTAGNIQNNDIQAGLGRDLKHVSTHKRTHKICIAQTCHEMTIVIDRNIFDKNLFTIHASFT